MELENQGGARVKVKQVELIETEQRQPSEEAGITSRCRWNVSGSIGHWGHMHIRTNQYDAIFTVEPVDGTWKITALDLLEENRIDTPQW